ncbi:MAG TPA: hypothetical protein VLD39_03780 [Gammaproteobacteria bacterium]|nr:hypothetical protein [Gammaproteobacteria bacterium]
MDRSRGAQKRRALDDYVLDGDSDRYEATGWLWEDTDLDDVDGATELDDQDLEIARLLEQAL